MKESSMSKAHDALFDFYTLRDSEGVRIFTSSTAERSPFPS